MASEEKRAYWRKKRKEYCERHPDRVKKQKAASFQRNKNTPKNLAKKEARKPVEAVQKRARYWKDPEKGRVASAVWRANHPEWYEEDKRKRREKRANRTSEQVEADQEKCRDRYLADQDNLKAKQCDYRKRTEPNTQYHREYLERNPEVRVKVTESSTAWSKRNAPYIARRQKRRRQKIKNIPGPNRYQKWTAAEDEIVTSKLTAVEVACLTGRTYDGVCARRRTLKRRQAKEAA